MTDRKRSDSRHPKAASNDPVVVYSASPHHGAAANPGAVKALTVRAGPQQYPPPSFEYANNQPTTSSHSTKPLPTIYFTSTPGQFAFHLSIVKMRASQILRGGGGEKKPGV
jgi:hypothetical protein